MTRITERIAWTIAGALGIAVVALIAGVVSAGPLTPPGPPTATQETLIYQPSSCAGFPVVISAPGSYKLADDINANTCVVDTIEITASNVSLDLAGFTVYGDQVGIYAAGPLDLVTVSNGKVEAVGLGGIYLPLVSRAHISNVQVRFSAGDAIRVGNQSVVDGCSIAQNGGVGVFTGVGAVVTDCTVYGGGTGFLLGDRSTISDCVAETTAGVGISLGKDSVLVACSASNNSGQGIFTLSGARISDCSANQNSASGIVTGIGASIEGCTASSNGIDGIRGSGGCLIKGNVADANGTISTGAGIHVFGAGGCRIEDNNVINNDSGIDIDVAGNTVFRNSARNNGAPGLTNEYTDIVGGNDVGVVSVAAASPPAWANIAY